MLDVQNFKKFGMNIFFLLQGRKRKKKKRKERKTTERKKSANLPSKKFQLHHSKENGEDSLRGNRDE